ncbi:hypothetical protein CDL15_Pgr017329 [Punica granatum]|uniref:Uncharacterized protein n=1 Tax=Punica granatum TaxID=22663 RepID=A0A218Y3L5_PUNGR|nr:hypothetical protein CDL15_Pgr017329 [Punica granatum]
MFKIREELVLQILCKNFEAGMTMMACTNQKKLLSFGTNGLSKLLLDIKEMAAAGLLFNSTAGILILKCVEETSYAFLDDFPGLSASR